MSSELHPRLCAQVRRQVARADFTRGLAPRPRSGPAAYKEWQHFLVHTHGAVVLINFNLDDDVWQGERVARVIVMVHREGAWSGAVERFVGAAFEASAGTPTLRFGRHRMELVDGAYRIQLREHRAGVSADLRLIPDAQPMLSTNRELAGARTLSWFFLPRLRAHGSVELEGLGALRVAGDLAYHDHNWGNFRWGDDFCWEWASILGRPEDRWTLVFMRVLDRARAQVRSAGLYLFRDGAQHRYFLDGDVQVHHQGVRPTSGTPLTLPSVMSLLAPGSRDVPEELVARARIGEDHLELRLRPGAGARVVIPNDTDLDGVTVLHELDAVASLEGRIQGEDVTLEGRAVFELIR